MVPNPHDVRLPVLVVTGADEVGLEKATAALARQSSAPVMRGAVAVVRDAAPARAPARTEVPRPFPAGDVATLAELGYTDTTVRGQGAGNLRLKLMLEGDAVVTPKGGRLTLNYAYPAQLDNRLSAMEVRVGGVSVRSAALSDPAGSAFSTLDVDIPDTLLGVDTSVDVVFHLFPRDYDPCSWYADTQIWATLLDSSTVTLPRDHQARMPDLALLAHRGWPYTLQDAASSVAVALPEAPSPKAWSTGLALVATLARWSDAEQPQVTLGLASTVPVDDSSRGHVIVLADSTPNAAFDSLAARNLLALRGGPDELALMLGTNILERVGAASPTDTMEQVAIGAGRSALVLRANSEEGFRYLLRTLTERARLEKLFGSAAVVGEDEVRPVDTQRALATWGELPLSTRAQRVAQREWWTLGVLALVGAIATTFGFRRLARRREDGKA